MSEIPLDQLMAAVGTAVNSAQRMIEEQAVERYCGYFKPENAVRNAGTRAPGGDGEGGEEDAGGSGLPTPELMRFAVPTPDGKKTYKEIAAPAVTMVSHNVLSLDVVRVSLAITSCRMEGGALRVEVDGQGRSSGADGGKNVKKSRKDEADDFVVSPSGCRYPFGGRNGSAIEMVFRHAPPAEGIRRLNLEQVKIV